ncbi:MAG: crotonase/enoyl-CoA hydratase family protein [Myxococcota bacterium]|nr:crotonase/enoyl-CoA hydratase family protein [Myxococcota bacterium]
MSEAVHCEQSGEVAIIRIDDGKANALDSATLGAIREGLDRAEAEASAVLLTGRPGRLSAGFNLGVFQQDGPDAARAMVTAGAELALQIARHPTPVVIGCTGHALAMGAVLLMAADLRIGAEGDFKVGFNEVAIGMATPIFLMEFARERLSKRHLGRAAVQAEIYTPEAAVDAGFFDRIVPEADLASTALAEAQRLGELPRGAFARSRKIMRSETLEKIEATLADDLGGAFPGGS